MIKSTLSPLGVQLRDSLSTIEKHETALTAAKEKDTIHIPSVGSVISTAYEQLRNASEYTEGDLLQQRAIRRYLKRVLSFHTKSSTTKLGEELVAELTQSEYLPNDHVTKAELKVISNYIRDYYGAYWDYAAIEPSADARACFQRWMLDVLAVRCEQTLQSHVRQLLFAHLAVTYFHQRIKPSRIMKHDEAISVEDTPSVLYIAVQRALLKSDDATIRAALVDSYKHDIANVNKFAEFNSKLDMLFEAKTTVTATRIVSKNGAAMRFIYSGFFKKDAGLTAQSLKSPEALDQSLHRHIEEEYKELDRKLDIGILRSVIFLLITKGIVGFAIEVPYDIMVYGIILWMPFFVNLLFPSIFIALNRLTLSRPIDRNTTAVISQATEIIFGDPSKVRIKFQKDTSSVLFNSLYAVVFLAVFAGLTWLLYIIQFNIVQGIIFFTFLSTAAFLAFRLGRQINEIEAVNTPQGSISLLRDIIYMPFIYVGQQISYRYAKINIVATVLDILIELPLKTILRLVRQWTLFLNAKKDELM